MWPCRSAGWPAPTTARWCSSTRPAAPAACRCDVGETDVYYFAPQKCFASDGGLWLALMSPAALDRVAEIAASGRYIPEFFALPTAIDNSRKDQTYNTPALATAAADGRPDRLDASATAAWPGPPRAPPTPRRRLYAWAEKTPYADAVRRRPGAALAGRRHDRLRRRRRRRRGRGGAARQRHRGHRALPQARPQPAADRRCSRRSTRPTSRRSPPASTTWSSASSPARQRSGSRSRRAPPKIDMPLPTPQCR